MKRKHVAIVVGIAVAVAALAGCGKKSNPAQPGPGGGGSETFDSGIFSSGSSPNKFVHTFASAGTFDYFCSLHGTATSGMRGTVHVATGAADSVEVNVADNQFIPNSVDIRPGGYVKWFATGGNHTVTR